MKIFALCFVLIFSSQSFAHADLMNGLVGWWKLDDASGASAIDNSSQENPATLQNNPTWTVNCIKKGCLTFNGSNQYLNVPNASSLQLTNRFSISAWVNPSNLHDYGNVLMKSSDGLTAGYGIITFADGHWNLQIMPWAGTDACITPAQSLVNGQWTLITATYDGSNGNCYVNGSLKASSASAAYTTETGSLRIGADTFNSRYFAGLIDDVRIYNRVLTATEVNDLYQQGQGHVSYGINSVIGNSKTSY